MSGFDTHIFDVDHTLTRHASGRHFVASGVRMGILPASVYLSLPLFLLRYRLGGLDSRIFERDFPEIRDRSRDELVRVANRAFDVAVRDDVHPEAEELIHRLKSEGRIIVLATSSLDIVVEPLARYLEIDEVIASSLEFKHGICSGWFARAPVFGAEKRKRVLDFLLERGILPSSCVFYSDSIHDLPLLEAVGKPVAVNPDFKLRREARRRGWSVLRFA
jgi:HAD superfamily hydrolase (TIGR01490 family)